MSDVSPSEFLIPQLSSFPLNRGTEGVSHFSFNFSLFTFHFSLLMTFPLSILAGICISIGCVVNLRVGGVAGAVLFAFGLTTVVYYGLKLYTGTAGFIRLKGDWSMLAVVLLGNIVGCLLSAWLISYAQPDCIEPATKILASRLAKGPWACFLLAIGCGFIMTTAVEFARKGKMLPLLLGVPVFILCGFAHSIADAFYFLLSLFNPQLSIVNCQFSILLVYLSEVLGNFVGCNLYRWSLLRCKK